MNITEIANWGRTMSTDEIDACQAGTDEDGTPFFPPEPLHRRSVCDPRCFRCCPNARPKAAFAEAFADAALEAAANIGWV